MVTGRIGIGDLVVVSGMDDPGGCHEALGDVVEVPATAGGVALVRIGDGETVAVAASRLSLVVALADRPIMRGTAGHA